MNPVFISSVIKLWTFVPETEYKSTKWSACLTSLGLQNCASKLCQQSHPLVNQCQNQQLSSWYLCTVNRTHHEWQVETYSWQVRGVSTSKYIWKHFFKPYVHHEVLGEQRIWRYSSAVAMEIEKKQNMAKFKKKLNIIQWITLCVSDLCVLLCFCF